MNIKIILILFFAILFSPEVSLAMIVPSANLTVIVNTQTDASFYFHLTGTQDFDLQTQNLSASKTISILAPSGSYVLSQDNVAGLKISNIFCISNNSNDVPWYQPNNAKMGSATIFNQSFL